MKYYIYHYALSTILNISIDISVTSVFQHQKPFWRQQTVKNVQFFAQNRYCSDIEQRHCNIIKPPSPPPKKKGEDKREIKAK